MPPGTPGQAHVRRQGAEGSELRESMGVGREKREKRRRAVRGREIKKQLATEERERDWWVFILIK